MSLGVYLCWFWALIVSLTGVAAEGDLFEHISVYSLAIASYTLQIAPTTEDAFDDETFAFMVVPTTSADEEGLESAESLAAVVWEEFAEGVVEPVDISPGDDAAPDASVVYRLDLATGNPTPPVTVGVPISSAGAYALFLQHGEEEITVDVLDASGTAVEAAAEESAEEHEEESEDSDSPTAKQWVNALCASFVISACSFVGIVLVASRSVARKVDLSYACLVASGALLATTLLHIVPEAIEGLEEAFPDDLHAIGLRAGLALMGGLFFGITMHAMLATGHSHEHNGHSHAHLTTGTTAAAAVSDDRAPIASLAAPTAIAKHGGNLSYVMHASRTRKMWDLKGLRPVCWNVIIGDLVHNFADGVTVGAAFLRCSPTVGWTVTAAAVLHEIPHEIADFMALINGGMTVAQAMVYNFLSALSAVAGVILVLALRDQLDSEQVSILLLLGGGSFIFIALTELVPDALTAPPTTNETTNTADGGIIAAGDKPHAATASLTHAGQAKKVISFIVGCLLIGIPLIWDEHCVAEGEEHSHR